MPRESAEEKIRRMIADALAENGRRQEEEKNPAWANLRRIIREEVAGVLQESRGGSRRRPDDQGDDEDDRRGGGGLADILGLG